MKQEEKNSTAQSATRVALGSKLYLIGVILAVVFLLIIAVVLVVNTINTSIYQERREYLSELTEASAKTVDEAIENERVQADMMRNVVRRELKESDDVGSFVSDLGSNLNTNSDIFVLVDADGVYYSSDGKSGRIADREYYTEDTKDSVEYLSTLPHLNSNRTYLIFRTRLDKPIRATFRGEAVEIAYFAMMHDLDQLNKTISSLFMGANNTFIYERDTGTMLYKQFGLGLLMDGYVIYPKLEKAEPLHGEDVNKEIQKCKAGRTLVTEIGISGEQFYFCSTSLSVDNWALAFIVQSDYISNRSGSSFNKVIYTVIAFALLLSVAVIAVVILTLRMRNQKKEQKTKEELEEARAAAEAASEAKSAFLFNMSHDIRTPMNAIIGFTNIAMKNIDDRKRVTDSLRKTQLSSNLLLALINDILEFSRIESGNVKLSQSTENIENVFEEIKPMLSDLAEEKNIELTFRATGVKNRYVSIDVTRCQRLLMNVISNGIKYTPDGGWVKAELTQVTDRNEEGQGLYRFTVEDNGIGMSEEFQEHLFEEFSREENSTTSGIQGTGLGLALCKAITDLMGGTIECESTQGKGSKFIITLLLHIEEGNESASLDEEIEMDEADFAGCHALLVEDNELNREIAADILSEKGITADEAEDGSVALEILKKKGIDHYDFILMDIQMPIMDGYETAKNIGQMFPDSNVPVIALSANAFEEDRAKSKEAGMTDHVAKPINVDELFRILAKNIEKEDVQ